MTKSKPKILVTNDDGITARGIRTLIKEMCKLGDVYVVAPDKPQSGKGHAITIDAILELKPQKVDGDAIKEISCTGTPADCVKLAINEVLDTKPDLCVSGINHGSNSSISVIYSGTMSAAIEAGIEGIPSIGFSLCDYSKDADFSAAKFYVRKIAKEVLQNGLPDGVVLNVNFPKISKSPYKGIKVCRQARANWREKFDKRVNPLGKEYFWLTGEFENLDSGEDTDEYWLAQNYISLVPIQFDLTAHHMIQKLNNWSLNE
ncbi:5'-nucleotidase [Wenyingzhuangia heitensis]|uniref:5'-nucleotidase SurE n=1 Tax=Wenyingzhuangia heitensis TaxID=1487859 RepID=A0ABX0UBB4_9FLAO|nr:5'/3'-nucleotidase SurE [Wenyingzhuangia heitensis]NIJ46114.1 5'-nucleotidase [Wenyingzhuangia heitensis]